MTRNREWIRMVLVIGSIVIALVSMMALSGCWTERRAIKSMAAIHAKFPELEARNCAERFPLRPDTNYGKSIVKRDTVLLPGEIVYGDCDSAWLAKNAGRLPGSEPVMPGKVAVKCPDQTIIHDSIIQPVFVTIPDLAALTAEQLAHKKTNDDLQQVTGSRNTWRRIGLAGIVLVVLLLAFIIWRTVK